MTLGFSLVKVYLFGGVKVIHKILSKEKCYD